MGASFYDAGHSPATGPAIASAAAAAAEASAAALVIPFVSTAVAEATNAARGKWKAGTGTAGLSRWAWQVDEALRRRVEEHVAKLGEERERTAAAEVRAETWQALAWRLEQQLEEERRRTAVAEDELRAFMALIQMSQGQQLGRAGPPTPCALTTASSSSSISSSTASTTTTTTTTTAGSSSSSSSSSSDDDDGSTEGAHHDSSASGQRAVELRDRLGLVEAAISIYRRVVECSRDALLLLRPMGVGAADTGPVVVFANAAAPAVLRMEATQVVHG